MNLFAIGAVLIAQEGPSESLLETVKKGGSIGYVIIGLSVVALVLVVMHLVQIRQRSLLPPQQIDEIDNRLSRGDAAGALAYCMEPDNDSYLTRILGAGLTRYQKSAFGAFEIKTAIEEAGEEETARLYRSTDGLGVIGSTAPLLGLLGTVVGMVGAFSTLSKTGGTKPELLAENISYALITTVLGLIVAIPCVALFTYFRNRIDALASEAGRVMERMILHLESPAAGQPGGARAPGAGAPAGPGPTAPPPRPVRPAPRPSGAAAGGPGQA
jgi:biopolymer transport protein ExbB